MSSKIGTNENRSAAAMALHYANECIAPLQLDAFLQGVTNEQEAKAAVEVLQGKVEREEELKSVICFDGRMIHGKQLGGEKDCMAVMMRIAQSIIDIILEVQKVGIDTGGKASVLSMRIGKYIKDLGEMATANGKDSMGIRTQQQVLNTLVVIDQAKKSLANVASIKEKMRACALLADLIVKPVTEEELVSKLDLVKYIQSKMLSLPEGVYLIRSVVPATNNARREKASYTAILVKAYESAYYIDARQGCFQLLDKTRAVSLIQLCLKGSEQAVISLHLIEKPAVEADLKQHVELQPKPTDLPYQRQVFSAYYPNQCIAEFDPGPYSQGTINENVFEIISTLNEHTVARALPIQFDPLRARAKVLEGGSCSSLSLRVANRSLEIMQELPATAYAGKALINRLVPYVDELIQAGKKTNQKAVTLQKEVRTIQHAYNAIVVVEKMRTSEEEGYAVHHKVNSLAAYFKMAVTASTTPIKVYGNPNLETEIEQEMAALKDGVYLLRMIAKANNHKLEVRGHSITIIKAYGVVLCFDPILGCYQLLKEAHKAHFIYMGLKSALSFCKVDYVSLNKLERYVDKPNEISMLQSSLGISVEAHANVLKTIMARITAALQKTALNCEEVSAVMDDVRLLDELEQKEAKALREQAIAYISSAMPGKCQFIGPSLTGTYSVGVKRYCLEDTSRNERDLGHRANMPRRLEIDVHYPAVENAAAPYKVLSLLNHETIEDSTALGHSRPGLKAIEGTTFPVVIFSPALGNSSDDYAHIVEELASQGYCVIAVNHPYSGQFTRALGNSQAISGKISVDEIIQEGLVNGADIAYIADVIAGKKAAFLHEIGITINDQAIVAMGHSLGGSGAVHACRLSSHLKGAVDLDGRIMHSESFKPLEQQPILLISAGAVKEDRTAYEEAYSALKLQNRNVVRVTMADAQHGDFSLAKFYRPGLKSIPADILKCYQQVNRQIIEFCATHLKTNQGSK